MSIFPRIEIDFLRKRFHYLKNLHNDLLWYMRANTDSNSHITQRRRWVREARSRPLTCNDAMEEIMRIRQAIIPAILALSAAGSILIGSAAPAAAAPTSSTVVVTAANPNMSVHGMFVHC